MKMKFYIPLFVFTGQVQHMGLSLTECIHELGMGRSRLWHGAKKGEDLCNEALRAGIAEGEPVAGCTAVVHSGAQPQPRITTLLGSEKEILAAYHLGFHLPGFSAISILGFCSLCHTLPSIPTYMVMQLYVNLLKLKTSVLQRLRSKSQLSA